MSIPYNDNLQWHTYASNSNWYKNQPEVITALLMDFSDVTKRAATEALAQIFKESVLRSIQFIRDGARLVLKVPIRSVWTPIILSKNWREFERTKINVKLTGYSAVQWIFVPFKSVTALAALVVSVVSKDGANWLLNKSESWTVYLDGRAAQLEALKEVGAKRAPDRNQYDAYKQWLYDIDPKLCCKPSK
ncbi:MAG: hypothetical protein P4L16_08025 [Chlamydiales bacterium]|nr:hypothetical protein [Chlamydiales bacterium]